MILNSDSLPWLRNGLRMAKKTKEKSFLFPYKIQGLSKSSIRRYETLIRQDHSRLVFCAECLETRAPEN